MVLRQLASWLFYEKKANLFSLSATKVTTVWLKQPTCFCSDIPESMLCMLKTHSTRVLLALSPLHTSAIITFGCVEMHVVFMKFLNLLIQNLWQVVGQLSKNLVSIHIQSYQCWIITSQILKLC